jgi:signal transduction histidine kinase
VRVQTPPRGFVDNSAGRVPHKLHRALRQYILPVKFHTERRGAADNRSHFKSCFAPVRDESGSISRILGLTEDVTEREEHLRQISKYASDIKRLTGYLINLRDDEQNRLSRELHERCSPNLAALKLNLELLCKSDSLSVLGKSPHLFEDTRSLLDDTIDSIRSITRHLRPSTLDYAGLGAAIKSLADDLMRRTKISVDLPLDLSAYRFEKQTETSLFRIVQEVFANIAKHSRAERVRFSINRTTNRLTFVIDDDGDGFDYLKLQMSEIPVGHGLLLMRERAESFGGRLVVDSLMGRGTSVTVEIPEKKIFMANCVD